MRYVRAVCELAESLKYIISGLLLRSGPETPILASVPCDMKRMNMMAPARAIDKEEKKSGRCTRPSDPCQPLP